MAQTRELLGRLHTVAATQQLTQAMKLVAAAKLAQAERKLTPLQRYSQAFDEIWQRFVQHAGPLQHPLLGQQQAPQQVLVLLCSTDKGLCGAYNKHLFKRLLQLRQQHQQVGQRLTVLPIGQKALAFLKQERLPCLHQGYVSLGKQLSLARSAELAAFLKQGYLQGRYQQCLLLYQRSKVPTPEHLQVAQLLPVLAPAQHSSSEAPATQLIYEPSKAALLQALLPQLVTLQLHSALLTCQRSEQSARMLTMGQASDNAEALIKELRLSYNRTRQEAITKEIIEIAAGAEALA